MRLPTIALVLLLTELGCSGRAIEEKEITHQPGDVAPEAKAVTDTIRYSIHFDDAKHHYIRVRAVYPAKAEQDIELSMAVWTPGSYRIREYARHIEDVRAATTDGTPLVASKTRKNRWRIRTGKTPGLVVEYKVYCNEVSVRGNFVDADSIILNGAPTFLTLADAPPRAAELRLLLPEGWHAQTGLDPHSTTRPNHFVAKSYDELVDSPILAGRELIAQSFDIQGIPHHVVHLGDASQWDTEEVLADVEQLVRTEARFWNVLPYEHFHFLNVILGGGGGLEHSDSTLMMAGPFQARTRSGYRDWLGLVAHEFFHTWNVKRLRPAALGPFDYENENHTRSLWIAEGITSYYDDLLLRRAGLLTEKQYLAKLGKMIQSLQTTPGRLVQPLALASYDAWIKYYQRDENSSNSSISYYVKGAVVAFLLDTEVRMATGGTKSLDDVMRLLYQRYSGDTGYTPEQFRATASEIAGKDLGDFFTRAIDEAQELVYDDATSYFGLVLRQDKPSNGPDKEKDDEDDPIAYLGVTASGSRIDSVRHGTPAYEAGLSHGDEILAIGGYRLRGDLSSLLARFRPEQTLVVTISRRGRLKEIPVTMGKEPEALWSLSIDSSRTQLQATRYRQWIAEYENL